MTLDSELRNCQVVNKEKISAKEIKRKTEDGLLPIQRE